MSSGSRRRPPVGLPESEAELYAALLGPVDFTVPTPAVVRDGQLAPYQELVWLTEPVAAERAYLAEHDARFQALTEQLREDGAFAEWVRDALPKRPRLARAGARLLGRGRTEAERQPPDLEDWLRLLEAYAVRHLAPQDSAEARDRYDEIALALRELGFELDEQGRAARPGRRGPAADRLAGQDRRPAGGAERRGRLAPRALPRARAVRPRARAHPQRRRAERRPGPQRGHRPPRAAHPRRRRADRAHAPADALHPRPALRARGRRGPARGAARAAEERFALPEWEAETEGLLVTLRSSGAEWMPRVWTELATVLLVEGVTTVLVGTRKLLGESWVCASLNVLVDLTVAEAGASVQQVRGRTLRLDRSDPEKVASNWEIVCAAPDRVRGGVDYARFVRKQAQLFGLTDEGTVESGPAHVHPELGSFAPPPAARFGAIDADQLARAADRATARERWQVGTPYLGVELPTLLVRALEPPGAPPLAPQDAGRVIAEAYRELGELSAEAAGSLRVRPAGAFRRCELTAATAAEGARFVSALDELCGPAPDAPTLLISRPLVSRLGRVLRQRGTERLHAMPADFARDEARAEVFARVWAKHLGPGRVFEAEGARPPDGGYETLVREVWV